LIKSVVTCGVSRESVLGSLLWNMAYNRILNTEVKECCFIICYANDTLIIVENDSVELVVKKAERCASKVVENIQEIGLKVSSNKTKTIVLCGRDLAIGSRNIRIIE